MTEFVPGEYAWVDLTNAKWFSQARWCVAVESTGAGTMVRMGAVLSLRLQYIFLWPLLRLTSGSITRDLTYLKRALESR